MELVSKAERDTGKTNAAMTPAGSEAVGTTGSNAAPIVTDLSKLTGSSAQQLVGQRVQLKDVMVDRLAGSRGFWAKSSDGGRVFIALGENIQQPSLQPGERVTIAGQVRKTPATRSAIDAKTWKLSEEDITELMQHGVFVRAHGLMNGNVGS